MPPVFRKRILVIGAGLGGLAAAIRLRLAGCEVNVIERSPRVGGRIGSLEHEGFRWETGPCLVGLPHVLRDLWERAGGRFEEEIELLPVPVTTRCRWQDGTTLDEDDDFWRQGEIAPLIRHGKAIYETGGGAFLHRPAEEWRDHFPLGRPALWPHLPKLLDPRPLTSLASRLFPRSPHLQQWLGWHAASLGASPYRAASNLAVLPFLRARFGGWFVRGGMARLGESLAALARRLGVVIETGLEVTRLQTNAEAWTVFVREGGSGPSSPRRCDGIICNQDPLEATRRYLDPTFTPERALSPSAFVIHAAVGRDYPELAHHNVFFSQDFHAEFAQLFSRHEPTDQPTIAVTVTSRTEASHAPEGCTNWTISVQAPPVHPKFDWVLQSARYAERILARFVEFGIDDPRPHIRWMKTITPADWKESCQNFEGSLSGYAFHGLRAPLARFPAQSSLPGLVFVGGATHPGPGLPMALLSGQIGARAMLLQQGGADIELARPLPA